MYGHCLKERARARSRRRPHATPPTGFLPPTDPRVLSTLQAVECELVVDDFLLRYRTESVDDGLPPAEGAFLACTFWLADAYVLQGQVDRARALFERLLSIRNDVGLLSEEYDVRHRRLLGNFPQAFSHIALINTAMNLTRASGSARQRNERGESGQVNRFAYPDALSPSRRSYGRGS